MAKTGRKTDYQKVREQDRRDGISITKNIKALEKIREEAETATKDDVPALNLRKDIAFGLLKKRLPDVKAVEHRVDGENEMKITIKYGGKARDT